MYAMQQPGRCCCIGLENNTAVVLTKQPDGRVPSRQLRERDNYFPSAELRILFLPQSPRISSPPERPAGDQRPPFEESRALCYSPTLNFRPLQPRRISSPNSQRSARVALCWAAAAELCCQGRNFHFNFLLSKVWMWHEMRYGSRANWYLINVWPDWRAQAHLPHVSSNMHDLQAGSLPQQTFHAMRSLNVKRRALPAHRGSKSSCRNSACTVPTRAIFYA